MVRERAGNVLRLMARVGSLDDHRAFEERAEDRPEHRALIRRAGAEGTVLLQNDGLLPLAKTGTVAVIGPNAKVAQIMGGGSAQLNPHYAVSPWDGLVSALGEAALSYAPGCTNHRFEPLLTGRFHGRILSWPGVAGRTCPCRQDGRSDGVLDSADAGRGGCGGFLGPDHRDLYA